MDSNKDSNLFGQTSQKTQNQNPKILRTPIAVTVMVATLTQQIENNYHKLTKLLRSN